jgi:hypothetical protein
MSQAPVLPPNERRILRLDEVEAKSGFKRAHIYNLMKKRQFPRRCAWACAPSAGIRSKSTSGSPSASTTGPDPFSRGLPIPSGERHAGRIHHFNQGRRRQDHDGRQPGRARRRRGPARAAARSRRAAHLSSYYELAHRAPGGIYELLAFNERDLGQLVSRTIIAGLDLVLSNDHRGELNTLLLHAPDGRLRLRHLLPHWLPSTTWC